MTRASSATSAAGSIDIGLPNAFSTTGPQTGQDAHGLAAAAGPAFEQASLPEEPDLAGREHARRRAQDRVDQGGPAAAEAGDEQHPRSVVGPAARRARTDRTSSTGPPDATSERWTGGPCSRR